MNSLRRVARAFDAQQRFLRGGYTEWSIILAIAGILLSAGDGICSWLLALLTPSLAEQFNALDKRQRVLLVGAPCAMIFLAVTIGMQWWNTRRRGDR